MFYLTLALLKLNAFFLSLLPRSFFLLLGRGLGRVLLSLGFREEVVRGNLELAFPDWSAERRNDFLKAHFQEMGILFLELLRMFYRFDRFYENHVDLEGAEHMREVLAEGKGAFAMTAHMGNWELLTLTAKYSFGTEAMMVTKELKPSFLHRVVEVTRSLLGVNMACEPRTMQGILRGLRKNQIVGFVNDQYAGAPVGARVPFFGKAVGSHTALAVLAKRTGVPVLPAFAVRKPNGRYLVRFEAPIRLEERQDPEATLIANTALLVRKTESMIREYPEQWLWIHRRWKGDLAPLTPHSEGEMLK